MADAPAQTKESANTVVTNFRSHRQIVLISGAPGAGKTTVAGPLADMLGFPLVSKDYIKETLFDTLDGPIGDCDFSRRIGAAAMEILWAVAERSPKAVLEANFRPYSEYEQKRLLALHADVVEVNCVCEPQEAARRFTSRALTGRHPAHPHTELGESVLAQYDRPMGIGVLLRVDTNGPVNVAALAERVGAAFSSIRTGGSAPDWESAT